MAWDQAEAGSWEVPGSQKPARKPGLPRERRKTWGWGPWTLFQALPHPPSRLFPGPSGASGPLDSCWEEPLPLCFLSDPYGVRRDSGCGVEGRMSKA